MEENSEAKLSSKEEEKKVKYSFDKEINSFVQDIESLNSSLPLVMLITRAAMSKASKNLTNFLNSKTPIFKDDSEGNKKEFKIMVEDLPTFQTVLKEATSLTKAHSVLLRSFIVSIVSQFDAYLGRLIRTIFYVRPELIGASEKNLTFSKLLEFNSIEDAKEFVIEKEVESVLRDSHEDQFKWLEKKLGLPLTKDLNVWPIFIEVTERRNLFVHCNGIISSQYINVCMLHKVKFDKECIVGEVLGADPEYFKRSYKCFFEIGIKLAHVIWRKLVQRKFSY